MTLACIGGMYWLLASSTKVIIKFPAIAICVDCYIVETRGNSRLYQQIVSGESYPSLDGNYQNPLAYFVDKLFGVLMKMFSCYQ